MNEKLITLKAIGKIAGYKLTKKETYLTAIGVGLGTGLARKSADDGFMFGIMAAYAITAESVMRLLPGVKEDMINDMLKGELSKDSKGGA